MHIHGRYFELSDSQKMKMRKAEQKFLSTKTVTTNRKDPFLYFIYENTLPPEEAYRVIHPKTYLVTNNLKETKEKGYKRRLIFDL